MIDCLRLFMLFNLMWYCMHLHAAE